MKKKSADRETLIATIVDTAVSVTTPTVGAVLPRLQTPQANRSAALIFYYYGDSKFITFFQETLKLKKAMEGYSRVVLLKHDEIPNWLDLSTKDEKLADVVASPTRANLFHHLKQLTADGYYIDLYIFSHGSPDSFRVSTGRHGSDGSCTAADILRELASSVTGYKYIPLRMVYNAQCYGQSLGQTWRDIGALTTAGTRYVEFYPTRFNNFISDWNRGNVSFYDAIKGSDGDSVRTLAQTWILGDAWTKALPTTRKENRWSGCPVGKTVLSTHDCAREYFTTYWLASNEWQPGKSGKENMNYSSFMFRGGEKTLTKNTRPSWAS